MRGIQMVTALMLFAAAFPIAAKDVSAEQSAVQYARQEFDKAEAEYKVDAAQAAGTRKASLSEKRKQQAKAKLDKAEEALDRAWKQ